MRKFYLEWSVVWLLCGHQITCQGNIHFIFCGKKKLTKKRERFTIGEKIEVG